MPAQAQLMPIFARGMKLAPNLHIRLKTSTAPRKITLRSSNFVHSPHCSKITFQECEFVDSPSRQQTIIIIFTSRSMHILVGSRLPVVMEAWNWLSRTGFPMAGIQCIPLDRLDRCCLTQLLCGPQRLEPPSKISSTLPRWAKPAGRKGEPLALTCAIRSKG